MSIKAWSFLVGRNQYIDYRTIVAPGFLCEAGLSSILARVVEIDESKPGEAFFRLVEGFKVGTITIVFQVVEAKEKDINSEGRDTPLTDSFGREIYLSKGFVFKGKYKKEDIQVSQTDIDNIYHKELMINYGEFWKKDITPCPPTDSKCFNLETQKDKILDWKLLKPYQAPIKVPTFYTNINIKNEVSSVAFSPVDIDNKIAIRSYNTQINIYSLSKDNQPEFISQIGKKVNFTGFDTDKSVCFSHDGKFVVYSTVVPHEKNVIKITRIKRNSTEQEDITLGGQQFLKERITAIVVSLDGRLIASASKSQIIRIWSVEKKKMLTEFVHKDRVNTIAISPDSRTLAAGTLKGNIVLFDLKNQRENNTQIPQKLEKVTSITFSPDGQTLTAVGYDKFFNTKLYIWELGTQEVIEISPQKIVNSIAYSPVDSRILVSAGKDKTIKLWNIRNPQREICTLDPNRTRHTKEVTSVAFSCDGRFLASGSKDGIVNIWDTESKLVNANLRISW